MIAFAASYKCARADERRVERRIPIGIPALASVENRRHPISVLDITTTGVMIAVRLELAKGQRLQIHCGSICTDAFVIWRRGPEAGLKFKRPLSQSQVQEQVSRSTAIRSRRREAATKLGPAISPLRG